jgi:hypothetical protein
LWDDNEDIKIVINDYFEVDGDVFKTSAEAETVLREN